MGIALDFIKPTFEMNSLFEKHSSGELLCNFGPLFDGYHLVVSSVDDIQQVMVKDARKFNIHWPGKLHVSVGILKSEQSKAVHSSLQFTFHSILWM